jgi:trehalose-6-phosphate synthase
MNKKGFIHLPLLIIIIAILGIGAGASVVLQQRKLPAIITNDISTANISETTKEAITMEPKSEIESKPKQISKSTEEVAEITQLTTEN